MRRDIRGIVELHLFVAVLALAQISAVFASEEGTNPVTGYEERVFSTTTSHGTEIAWQVNDGSWQSPVYLTNNFVDDLDPQICFEPTSGDRFILFWRDSSPPGIFLLRGSSSANSWSTEEVMSSPLKDNRSPHCTFYDGSLHVAYTVRPLTGGRGVILGKTNNDPLCPGPDCPISLRVLHTTNIAYGLDLKIHNQEGKMWVDWVDSSSQMAYSEYDELLEEWGAVNWMNINVDIASTRTDIRNQVIGY